MSEEEGRQRRKLRAAVAGDRSEVGELLRVGVAFEEVEAIEVLAPPLDAAARHVEAADRELVPAE
jgi:hypothetical protein